MWWKKREVRGRCGTGASLLPASQGALRDPVGTDLCQEPPELGMEECRLGRATWTKQGPFPGAQTERPAAGCRVVSSQEAPGGKEQTAGVQAACVPAQFRGVCSNSLGEGVAVGRYGEWRKVRSQT